MEQTNKLLKISSIIYLLIALLIISFNTLIGGIILTIGMCLLSYSFLSFEELKRKKIIILILAIITFIFSKIIGILLFIAFDKIVSSKTNNATEKNLISTETKRIDILLKIGISMILISGILFATTSWNIISDLTKCIGLALMGIIFLILSNFTEKKLNLIKSSEAYYCLGLIFFLLTYIGISGFGIISNWFTYIGEGKSLVYFGTFLLLSGILFLIYKKYNKQEYHYLGYLCIFLCIFHILTFIGFDLLLTTLIISVITLFINIFVKNETLSSISKTLSYIYWIIFVIQALVNTSTSIILILGSLINIINIIYLIIKTDDSVNNIFGIIIVYILLVNIIGNIELSYSNMLIFGLATIIYLIVNYNKINNNKAFLITNQIIYNLLITIILLTMSASSDKLFIFSLIYGIINFVVCYIIKKSVKIDLYYQPVIIFIIVISLFNFLEINELVIYPFIVTAIIYALIHYLIKDVTAKKIYFIVTLISSILCALMTGVTKELIPGILIIGLAAYLYMQTKSIWNYVFILFTILILEISVIEHWLPSPITSIFVLLIFGCLTYLIDDYQIRRINLISLAIPLYSLVSNLNEFREVQTVLYNIFSLYILFLIIKLFIKKSQTKDLIATIGTSLLLLNIIFNISIIIGIYIGIVGLLIIFITYSKKEYKSYFYCGIVVTILNIIVQLGEFWERVPVWLYLLLAGISIIGFVTYREVKKLNQKDEEQHEKENLEIANFCIRCGQKNNGGKYCIRCGNSLVIKNKK